MENEEIKEAQESGGSPLNVLLGQVADEQAKGIHSCYNACMYKHECCKNAHKLERLRDTLVSLEKMAMAYPVEVFPEPDFEAADKVLQSAGLSLSCISAANMRHMGCRILAIIYDAEPNAELTGRGTES